MRRMTNWPDLSAPPTAELPDGEPAQEKPTAPGDGDWATSEITAVLEALPQWAHICRSDGTIEKPNRLAARLSGYAPADLVGQRWPYPWLPELPQGAEDPLAALWRTGEAQEFEAVCVTPQAQTRPLLINLSRFPGPDGAQDRVLFQARDLTEDKRRDAERIQAHKIQAVSQLASGVAHDINNNLAVILGYAELLINKSQNQGHAMQQALNAIQEQAVECAGTVRRIQLFARPIPQSQFTPTQVNDVAREVIKLTEPLWLEQNRRAGAAIKLETDLAELPQINAYLAGLKEALVNLIKNSVEALPQGGVITVRTRHEGNQVSVEVSDNGLGVDPRHVNRIFDPFYTTKGPSHSGLGLSIAHNLITQQGGSIKVTSAAKQGATFTITLPLRRDPAMLTNGERAMKNRYLSVLVVDDEPLVGQVLEAMLQASGHRVTTCLAGTEALEVFQKETFDLAVVDLGMPDLDGWEVARQLNLINPRFPVIIATGWNVSVENGVDRGVSVKGVLRKPFGVRELGQAILQATGVKN